MLLVWFGSVWLNFECWGEYYLHVNRHTARIKILHRNGKRTLMCLYILIKFWWLNEDIKIVVEIQYDRTSADECHVCVVAVFNRIIIIIITKEQSSITMNVHVCASWLASGVRVCVQMWQAIKMCCTMSFWMVNFGPYHKMFFLRYHIRLSFKYKVRLTKWSVY